jgi:gluconolactonase
MKQTLQLSAFRTLGSGLQRPEGICVDADGTLWAADQKSLLARIAPDGSVTRFGQGGATPNGLAVDSLGRILIAEYEHGTLWRFNPGAGSLELILSEVNGRKTSRANYPAVDLEGRIWCTSSTGMKDDLAALRTKIDDGFVFVLEKDGTSRIVAEGLHFANGLAFSKDFEWLYIVESSTRRIVRARVLPGGHLGQIENFGPELEATPDGIGFDEEENLWVTLLLQKSALVSLDSSGCVHCVVEDPTERVLGRPTNVSFGGPDMCDLYVGSLDRDAVLHARVEIPGIALPGQSRTKNDSFLREPGL